MTTAPSADLVMERLLKEATREFPGWVFERDDAGWTAAKGEFRFTRHSLAALRALLRVHRATQRR
ncbi:MAG TPA: hypothetical protein VFV66_26590 [Nonomuraea sp.]|nr:hypothetical protein [Nonomuraea sp.]